MKPKHQRLVLALLALAGIAGAGILGASALRDEAAYFRTPTEVRAGKAETGEAMRLGGMVAAGSIARQADGVTIRFVATDGKASVPVEFTGIVPDLFAENSGMVADGRMRADGVFVADRILAKHDERYMPPQMGEMPKNMKRVPGE
ncbi:cytochrome c maturation protein CcmE [Sphingopyxis sp. 113P3]|jgi:Cytochrome c-type biogenesis protein CcmE|uniref:cytochrome c maturation protein CcmE n=1 Tax=Sphingopyxis sp. (strain 113P3) TaxID=292913 RepID=UPI0006AD164D|nr:cytochrome c maturation protein CcmE [Sphingopyxis sp. 113P3]ALC11849.1 cytochrome C biogenesis protein CcmE [Sphingopyxis sp. 113P3]